MKIAPKWSSNRTMYEQKRVQIRSRIIYREMWLMEKTRVKILVEKAETNSKHVQP